ncbi:Multidrug resistance-associated protein 1, partial [Linderina pennispora]
EMPLVSGTGYTYGRIGYVSQKPWIMNAMFHENVLFGQAFDEKFYWRVVKACALAQDVKLFPAQDLSEIGPRGINLSGGQKVRLALARTIYSRADIYVLDDLLAAVDAHVERHLIENVLVASGVISDKTRILVTHAEHVVPLADKVITLTSGVADIVEQNAAAFTQSPPKLPSEDDEDLSKDGDEGSGQSTLDPEIGVPQFQWSYMWRYLRMSGLHIVGVTFAIQAAGAYATFYVDSLRLNLVMDNNRESMV